MTNQVTIAFTIFALAITAWSLSNEVERLSQVETEIESENRDLFDGEGEEDKSPADGD